MHLSINQIYHGDARQLLQSIEPNSIDLSVWSPPYHLRKEYEKDMSFSDWIDLLNTVIGLHFDILKEGAFLAVNIADILAFSDESMPRIQAINIHRQRSDITRELVLDAKKKYPDYSRQQLANLLGCSEQTIDRRLNGNNIRGGKHIPQTRVKLTGHLIEEAAMSAGLYLYDRRVWVKDPTWQNSKWHSLSYRSVSEFEDIYIFWKPGITIVDRKRLASKEWSDWGSRAVWHIPSVRANNDHEAKFPLELPRRLIKLLSPENGTILDCFVGSGTSMIAAIQERRNYIGIDKEEKYAELSRRRIQEELSTANQLSFESLE